MIEGPSQSILTGCFVKLEKHGRVGGEAVKMSAFLKHTRRKRIAACTCPGDVIAAILQELQKVWFPGFDEMGERTVAPYVRIPAGEHRNTAGAADGILRESVGELDALMGKRIQMRRVHNRVAKRTDTVGAQLVRHED